MNVDCRWFVLVAALLISGGCATEGPVKSAGLEQKIEAARIFQQSAAEDLLLAREHRQMAAGAKE